MVFAARASKIKTGESNRQTKVQGLARKLFMCFCTKIALVSPAGELHDSKSSGAIAIGIIM